MEKEYEVTLYVYDLSNGMAASMSQQLMGEYFEGIWHTGVGYNGREWYFGGGIFNDKLNSTPYGKPLKVIKLGNTSITPDIFEEFIENIRPRFRMEDYNLIEHNCNNFSDEVATFLLGKGIPSDILELPKRALSTPLGKMLQPFIQQYQNNVTNFYSPSQNVNPNQNQQQVNLSRPNTTTTNNNVQLKNNNNEQKLIKKANLVFFKDKNVKKIIPKLQSFVYAVPLLKEKFESSFSQLLSPFEQDLEKSDLNDFCPPDQTIDFVITLCNELPDENKYPAMDLLRVLLFNKANLQNKIVPSKLISSLLRKYLETEQSKGFKLILFRNLSNLFSNQVGIDHLLGGDLLELLVDCSVKSLNETEIFTLMGAASFTYNLTFQLVYNKHLDQCIQLTSCLVDKINEIQETSELYSNVALLFLISLGNLVHDSVDNVSLVNTLQVNIQKFQSTKVDKVKQAARELATILLSK